MKPNYLTLLTALVLLITLSGCGGPSDSVITAAVTKSLQSSVPGSLSRSLVRGSNANVVDVQIKAKGNPSGSGSNKTWPVKVYVKGSCEVMFRGRIPFEGEIEYLLSKDAYGDWKANSNSMF